jgi:hypothetical protein
MNPADDEPARITGCVGESFEPDTREMTVDLVVKVGRPFDRQLGIHEASHVVCSYMLLSVEGSTIEFVDGHHGRTWANEIDIEAGTETVQSICSQLAPLMAGALDSQLEETHAHVCAWLAGIEGEALFCDGELLPNTQHDLDAARSVAGLITREVDAYITFAKAQTRALLLNHGAAVLGVANALIRHRTINRSQIDTIMKANG